MRNHVVRQTRAKRRAQSVDRGGPIEVGGKIGDQLLVAIGQPCRHDARLPNARDFEQSGFHFVGGHLIAADLDLEVLPAQVLQDAVRSAPADIPGDVGALGTAAGIRPELFVVQLRPSPISLRQKGAADGDFARLTRRRLAAVVGEQEQAQARHVKSDGRDVVIKPAFRAE